MAAVLRVLCALAAAISISPEMACSQAVGNPPSQSDSPGRGTLVSVGSHRVFCECDGMGEPVIILQTGITETFRTWEPVLDELKKTTRVCAYDRAGYGESEPGPMPRSGEQACLELQGLLDAVLPEARVVLLGHSLGAMHAILFASRFPERVAGMVLVDPPPLDFLAGRRFANLRVMAEEATGEWERTAQVSSREGQEKQAAFFRTIAAEHRAMFAQDTEALAAIESLADLPMVVVASGRPNPAFGDSAQAFQEFWIESSRSLAALSSQGKLVVAEGSGHHVHREEPDLLLQAVAELLQSLRDEVRDKSQEERRGP